MGLGLRIDSTGQDWDIKDSVFPALKGMEGALIALSPFRNAFGSQFTASTNAHQEDRSGSITFKLNRSNRFPYAKESTGIRNKKHQVKKKITCRNGSAELLLRSPGQGLHGVTHCMCREFLRPLECPEAGVAGCDWALGTKLFYIHKIQTQTLPGSLLWLCFSRS